MTKHIWLLPLFLLCACSIGPRTPTMAPQDSPVVQQAQNSPQPRVVANTPIPTRDWSAATLQAGILYATETERAYERQIIGLTSTQQAVSDGFVYASQTARAPEATRQESYRSTDVAMQLFRMTQSAEIMRATQNAPELLLKAAEAEAQAKTAWARAVLPIFAVIALILFSAALFVYVWRNPRKEPESVIETEDDPHPELMKVGETLKPGPSVTPPGDPVRFSQYAIYALNGFPLGRNAVEVDAKIYTQTGEDSYGPIYAWMAAQDYIVHDGKKITLSDVGREYCENWLRDNPPHPTDADMPKDAPAVI